MSKVWMEVTDALGKKSYARFEFFSVDSEDNGEIHSAMTEPEVIGCRASIESALNQIAIHRPGGRNRS